FAGLDIVHGDSVVFLIGDEQLAAIVRELDAFGLRAADDLLGDLACGQIDDGDAGGDFLLAVILFLDDFLTWLRRRPALGAWLEGNVGSLTDDADEFRVDADGDVLNQFAGLGVENGDVAFILVGYHQGLAVRRDADAARRAALVVDLAHGFHGVEVDDGDAALLVGNVGDTTVGAGSRLCRGFG